LKRSEPRKEGAVSREDPRDDDERIFGPCEMRIVKVEKIAHCAVLKRGCKKEKMMILIDVEGKRDGGRGQASDRGLMGFYW
jgi:hypothetical protein